LSAYQAFERTGLRARPDCPPPQNRQGRFRAGGGRRASREPAARTALQPPGASTSHGAFHAGPAGGPAPASPATGWARTPRRATMLLDQAPRRHPPERRCERARGRSQHERRYRVTGSRREAIEPGSSLGRLDGKTRAETRRAPTSSSSAIRPLATRDASGDGSLEISSDKESIHAFSSLFTCSFPRSRWEGLRERRAVHCRREEARFEATTPGPVATGAGAGGPGQRV
jgi:hypothetical protein